VIQSVYNAALSELKKPVDEMKNLVREIYKPFSTDEISAKISSMLNRMKLNQKSELYFKQLKAFMKLVPDIWVTGTLQVIILLRGAIK